jgi:MFS family permease
MPENVAGRRTEENTNPDHGLLARIGELAWQVAPAIGSAVGFLGFVAVVGAAIEWVRFNAANLPATQAVDAIPKQELVVVGGLALGVYVVFAVIAVVLAYVVDSRGSTTRNTIRVIVAIGVLEMIGALLYVKDLPVGIGICVAVWLLVTGAVVASLIAATVGEFKKGLELREAREEVFRARGALEAADENLATAELARARTPRPAPGGPAWVAWQSVVGVFAAPTAAPEGGVQMAEIAVNDARRVWQRALFRWREIVDAETIEPGSPRTMSWRKWRRTRDVDASTASPPPAVQQGAPEADRSPAGDLVETLLDAEVPSRFRLKKDLEDAERPRASAWRRLVAHTGALFNSLKDARGTKTIWTIVIVLIGFMILWVKLALSSSFGWLLTMLVVASVLIATNVVVARATETFAWYGVSIFFSVLVFGAAVTVERTKHSAKMQPIALVRKGDDIGICGVYVTQTSDRVYIGRVGVEGGGAGRMFWVPLADVDLMSIGDLQPVHGEFDLSATELLAEVYGDRAEEQARTPKPTTITTVVGPATRQRTTVREVVRPAGRPRPHPEQFPRARCSVLEIANTPGPAPAVMSSPPDLPPPTV